MKDLEAPECPCGTLYSDFIFASWVKGLFG